MDINDPAVVEALRQKLLAHGVDCVIGMGSGSGDSADIYWCNGYAAIDFEQVKDVAKALETQARNGVYYSKNMANITMESGEVVVVELYDEGSSVAADTLGVEIPNTWASISGLVGARKVDLPKDLEDELDDLFDSVVDSYQEWDFNNDGSQGTFSWNLKTNESEVDASYNIMETESFGGEGVMGESWDAEQPS